MTTSDDRRAEYLATLEKMEQERDRKIAAAKARRDTIISAIWDEDASPGETAGERHLRRGYYLLAISRAHLEYDREEYNIIGRHWRWEHDNCVPDLTNDVWGGAGPDCPTRPQIVLGPVR